jgi:hypothetical protein
MPAVGGTVAAVGFRLPGMGLSDEPLHAMGPELTIAVVVEAVNPAGFAAPGPECVLFQRLFVSSQNQQSTPRVQMTQTAAAAGSWCFRFPLPPECSIEADVTSAATLSGNPEPVNVHLKAYVISQDTTLAPEGD